MSRWDKMTPSQKQKELDWQATPEQKKRRAARNKSRASAMKAGTVSKGDGMEVHHTKSKRRGPLTGPTRVVKKTTNRKIQPKRT